MYTLNIENPEKLFFTSDTHFGHFNICKYCQRPFENRSEMDKTLIENWNSVVPDDGIVVHCGDFTLIHKESLSLYEKIIRKLNGRILLCRGNHDRIPIAIGSGTGMDKLIASVDIATIFVEGKKIIACHYPLLSYPSDYQVFGHIHTRSDGQCSGLDADVPKRLSKTQYDVGVDQNNYTPISYEKLMRIFNEKS